MSFKDKPLKKIVSDKRITIDAIHKDMIQTFTENKQQHQKNQEELKQLEKFLKNDSGSESDTSSEVAKDIQTVAKDIQTVKKEIKNVKKKIDGYDTKEDIEYHLKCGMLLSEYYSKKNGEVEVKQNQMSVLDFMNKKNKKAPAKDNFINDYISMVDDNVISCRENDEMNMCPICLEILVLKHVDSLLLCEQCGYTKNIIINSEKVSYKDPPRESSYFAYKRINHFNEWLAQFQAKETTDIPQEVYHGIIDEIKKDPFLSVENINYKNVREILKKLKFNKYYEHIPHIINILNGEKAPILTRQYEEQLRMMFKEIQTPFMKHCPQERKNFLSYSYVLHKFCQLLELDDLLVYFPLLKSREKLQQQDRIWEKICGSLEWQYIPSI